MIKDQICDYFESSQLYSDSQFGFRSGRNTTQAVCDLINYVVGAFEQRESVQAVFCDLSKAFDCVEHNILISKLKFYGFADNALNLIASYLTDRRQLVVING